MKRSRFPYLIALSSLALAACDSRVTQTQDATSALSQEDKNANWQRILDVRAGKIVAATPTSAPVTTPTPVATPMATLSKEDQAFFDAQWKEIDKHPNMHRSKKGDAEMAAEGERQRQAVRQAVTGTHLKIGTIYADSKEDFETMISLCNNSDEAALEEMYRDGKISLPTRASIPVTVVSYNWGVTSFRIRGNTKVFWAASEFVQD